MGKQQHLSATDPIILHDNARAHPADAVEALLRRYRWEILEHPPYSPDTNLCDYDLFTKMKEPL
jgi:transposase